MTRPLLLVAACLLAACDADPVRPEPPGTQVFLRAATAINITGAVAGRVVEPVPVVQVVTAEGAPVPGITVVFTANGGGSILNSSVETGADGTASPGSWILSPVAGANVLTALVTPRSHQVLFTAIGAPGPVAEITEASGDHQFGRAGETLPSRLRIRAVDQFGNGVPDVPVTFEVIEGGGTIEGRSISTDAEGYAQSGRWTLGPVGGRQAVLATVAGLEVLFTATMSQFAAPATLTYIADDGLHEGIPGESGRRTLRESGMDPARELAWSPDGRRLAFEWPEDGWYSVALTSLDDWRPVRLAARFSRPAWSPDGRTLAAATGDCVYRCDLYTLNPDPASPTPRHLMGDGYFPAWSPDGSEIAYVRMSGDDGYHALHVMNADGSNDREIVPVSGPAFDHPTWSPDGKSIAFAKCQGTCRLFVVGVDGSGLRQLVAGDNMHSPAWSPDGRWIAFNWIRNGASSVAYVTPEGGTPAVVGAGKSPSWRPTPGSTPPPPPPPSPPPPPAPPPVPIPSDRDLALVRDSEIHVVRTDGTGLVQLTFGERGLISQDPDWSPDGERLAFVRSNSTVSESWIYLMGPDGNLQQLINGSDPAWSPDGRTILFTNATAGGDRAISLVDLDTRQTRVVRSWKMGWVGQPAWSPDGERVTFTSDAYFYDTHFMLYSMRLDGSDLRALTTPDSVTTANGFFWPWQAYHSSSWSPDGRTIAASFVVDSAPFVTSSEIRLLNSDGRGRRPIAGPRLQVSYTSPTWSPDGRTIAFVEHDQVTRRSWLKYLRVDGSAGGEVLENGHSPDWRPAGSTSHLRTRADAGTWR